MRSENAETLGLFCSYRSSYLSSFPIVKASFDFWWGALIISANQGQNYPTSNFFQLNIHGTMSVMTY